MNALDTPRHARFSRTLKEFQRIIEMFNLCQMFVGLKADSKAVTALEYAMIAALIAVAAVGIITSLGTQLSTTFSTVSSAL